jgi:hypothetical protein
MGLERRMIMSEKVEHELELEKYAELEESEVGEACILLCELDRYPDYVSKTFYKELQK